MTGVGWPGGGDRGGSLLDDALNTHTDTKGCHMGDEIKWSGGSKDDVIFIQPLYGSATPAVS